MRGIVAGLILLAGCGQADVFYADDSFTPVERAIIEESAHRMAIRTGGDPIVIRWGATENAPYRILRAAPATPSFIGQFVNDAEAETKTLYLTPGLDMATLRRVSEHEFGHYFGLEHLPTEKIGVMSAIPASAWTLDDVRECQRVRSGCSPYRSAN